MASLTIFANFRINNEERYLRMQDSFFSFKDINAEKWVINVRGLYKHKTLFFLNEHLKDNLFPHLIESGKGWFHDTKMMLEQIDTDYVLFWIEDHINMTDTKCYDEILEEMALFNCDSLMYSWFGEGYLKRFRGLSPQLGQHVNIYSLNEANVKYLEDKNGMFYIVSAVSILKVSFFKSLINTNHPVPKRWPKDTPFDFEKKSSDYMFLPIIHAVPKYELFASIDDDHFSTCLITRGLYAPRKSRMALKNIETENDINQLGYKKRIKATILSFVKKLVK